MIKHNLHIYSQNARKNKILTDSILEMQKNLLDIIFIQEPPRFLIWHAPSHTNPNSDPVYGISNHPDYKRTSRVVLSKFWESVLLVAQWQIMYHTPTIPESSLSVSCSGNPSLYY